APATLVDSTGARTGRGWNGGLSPDQVDLTAQGPIQGPASPFSAGTRVDVIDVSSNRVFGTPKDRATFTFEGDTPGTSFMLTGIFEDRASNAAQWARFGANWTQSHGTAAGYLRDGDVVTKVDPATGQDVQLAPNTEANRLNIIARAWM